MFVLKKYLFKADIKRIDKMHLNVEIIIKKNQINVQSNN